MTSGPRRRFWSEARVRPDAGRFGISLDGRPLRTPLGAALLAPTAALAGAIAAEWNALGPVIDPTLLPLTRLANSAIDRARPQHGAVVSTIAEYGATDLLCYRAEGPEALRSRQAAGWDPWLCWAAETLAAPLVTTSGVVPRSQPAASLASLRARVAGEGAFGLVSLHELVALTGSLVLGLAVRRGVLGAASAWELSRLDEIWQAEQWGLDAEAEEAAFLKSEALLHAARFGDLLRAA